MARRVFFSFHWERDVWRANVVRNAWVTHGGGSFAGYHDHAEVEAVRRQGETAVRRWIDGQLEGSSVTCVLIGTETASRPFVQYEIRRSVETGRGLLGVYIGNIRDRSGNTDWYPGPNPFDSLYDPKPGLFSPSGPLSRRVATFDWFEHDGYRNLGAWVEDAARRVGR